MIVNVKIEIENNNNPDLQILIARHPSIIERSPLHYTVNKDFITAQTRLQVEASHISHAELIIVDSLNIDEGEDIPVDEASQPLITITEETVTN